MAYKYDVFISYRCKYPYDEWVTKEFLPLFKSFLEEAIVIREAKIFVDKNEIEGGQSWKNKIKDALIHSRIMVSILSPSYFLSEYCKKEFAVMDYRQKQAGYLTVENPNGLIVPIKISDGDSFPPYVLDIFQITNFNDYSRLGISNREVRRGIDFQDCIIEWVEQVANAWRNAPSWDEKWKYPDWIDKAWENLDHLDGNNSRNPPTL